MHSMDRGTKTALSMQNTGQASAARSTIRSPLVAATPEHFVARSLANGVHMHRRPLPRRKDRPCSKKLAPFYKYIEYIHLLLLFYIFKRKPKSRSGDSRARAPANFARKNSHQTGKLETSENGLVANFPHDTAAHGLHVGLRK